MTVILTSPAELRGWRMSLSRSASVGFVPTMGALHRGHMELARTAREQNDHAIVSIFVNPLQFGPTEDLDKYPRTLDADLKLLRDAGIAAAFLPGAADMYPKGASTTVLESAVSLPLCGAFRPGHFAGVATVVLKLLNLVQPDRAYFGQKDAQQCAVVERLVRDLDVPTQIVRCPIVREPDGLALSSRNAYLSPAARSAASLIHASLRSVEQCFLAGERRVRALADVGRKVLASRSEFHVQYYEVRDAQSLRELDQVSGEALVAVAAYLDGTRLIDNTVLVA